jgi:erythromycin esterase-like protein/predicted phosphoribosyltransferase
MEFVPFSDRKEAGRKLADKLASFAHRSDVLVLALPRGGVPVAFEVANRLRAPLDVLIVRKLGVPGYEELAMGAIVADGAPVLNEDVVAALRVPPYIIETVAAKERQELRRRERLYRGGRTPPDVKGRTVVLVDDGLATGSTMLAAIQGLRQGQPARIIAAVPVAPPDICEMLRREADEVICAVTPKPFVAVGHWYREFAQTTDQEVRRLLAAAGPRPATTVESGDVLTATLRAAARRLTGAVGDYDLLLARIGDARLVLLGEASHGTHDFYEERAKITQRLIDEKGFTAVAVEADWPDAYRVNRYVRAVSEDVDATEALADFRRFPTWMWRNTCVVEFVEWLRAHNDAHGTSSAVGFYGLDLYSLHTSIKAVLGYLGKIDPDAARRARHRYSCFDQFGEDSQTYGLLTGSGLAKSCQDEVIQQLVELQRAAMDHARRSGVTAGEEFFYAEQNARVVRNAEAYYRSMLLEEVSSWNLRDGHMVETLDGLVAHLGRHDRAAKVVVWAHNSHLGDARATQRSEHAELNVGQLVREKYGSQAVLIGFTTHHGTVTAASDWGKPAERKTVRPALPESYESLFHHTGIGRFWLSWQEGSELTRALRNSKRLQRAIGVIYRPETERASHYFWSRLADQFDAILHFDETRAVEPIERTGQWDTGDAPETFPFAV